MKWKNKSKEFDAVGYNLRDKKHVYLYGVGGNVDEILPVLTFMKSHKFISWDIHLIDRDEKKQRTGHKGYDVISPNMFFNLDKEDYFVVACPTGAVGKEIHDYLLLHDVDENIIYDGDYFLYTYLSIYFLYCHNIVFFTSQNILPSTVCNLNCRDCLNFTPYIKKHVTEDLDRLKRDVDSFFGAVDYIYRFQVTGGEPLLYPALKEFFTYIDENYRRQIIRLEMVTNGTVIPKDDICEFLAAKNIYVFLDDYRECLPHTAEIHQKIENTFQRFGVKYVNNYVAEWIRLYDEHNLPLAKNEVELSQLFNVCGNPWSCLWRGKISACNYGLYAAKAGVCCDDDDEYYDLTNFTPEKKKELVEFRLRYNSKGYVNLCRKCHGWTSINTNHCPAAVQTDRR